MAYYRDCSHSRSSAFFGYLLRALDKLLLSPSTHRLDN
jgi:hypothetical protein